MGGLDEEEALDLDDVEIEYGEATDFAPGGMVGRYQLCFELASGGMAKVYLARIGGASGFDKLVALKRIHPHLADQHEFLEMFMDEARLASRIDHPNVCTVFDFGRAGREHFIAMEYLLGETLARVSRHVGDELAASPRWWALAMRVVAEASEGLHAAHELRNDEGEPLEVVHRDVTPANVFVTYDGAVKVVDFGVARAQERVHQTRAGRVKGQYAYMAPEQARGAALDRRADVWSLGVLLWELLAGRRLFARENEAATLMAVVGGEIPPLRSVRPEIPEDIAAIVARALSLDPQRRPTTARALARDLDRCIARLGEPVGKPDLGDLMERLFADDIVRRKRMIADSRRLEAGRVLKVEDSSVAPLVSETREVGGDPTRIAAAPAFDAGTAEDLAPRSPDAPAAAEPGAAREAPPAPRRGWLLPAAIGAIAIGGIVLGGIAIRVGAGGPVASPQASIGPPPPIVAATAAPEPEVVAAPEIVAAVPEIDPADEPGAPAGPGDAPVAAAADPVDEPQAGPQRRGRRERPRSRVASSVARAPGTVNVVTPGGWADVYLGRRRVGRSPGRIELPAGHHTLELRPFGGQPARRVGVDITPGGTARVSVPVTR